MSVSRINLDHLRSGLHVVAIDLDGTVVGEDLEVRPFTRQVFAALHAGGIRVIITTGRMFSTTLAYARILQGEGPVVCYQGALIRDLLTKRTLFHEPLDLDLSLLVLAALEAEDCVPNLYVDDTLFVLPDRPQPDLFRRVEQAGVRYRTTADLRSQLTDSGPTKILVTGAPSTLDQIGHALRSRFPGRLYVRKSLPPFLEIAAGSVSKSRALAFLADRYGFTPEEVVAFGDGHNDVDLLAWAGLGVAPANALPDVQAAADTVCGHVDQEGVARFLLGPCIL
jgi:Cof subfamily protein (haloacid dehalogenase superfamily)